MNELSSHRIYFYNIDNKVFLKLIQLLKETEGFMPYYEMFKAVLLEWIPLIQSSIESEMKHSQDRDYHERKVNEIIRAL